MTKILMVTAELAEVAPVGGVAEYVYGLAAALMKRGHEVRVALPSYSFIRSADGLRAVNGRLVVRLGVGASEVTAVHEKDLRHAEEGRPVLPLIVLGEHRHFASARSPKDIYQWPNHEPWIAFSRSVIDLLNSAYWSERWQPEVIHCQDAHTSLIPVYIKRMKGQSGSFASSVRTVLTIHNLLNQGAGSRETISYAGLPPESFDADEFEYYGHANCFKAGLLAADRANTVSRTYAAEICESHEYGFGLEGVLRRLRHEGRLTGIVNGIDEDRWKMDGLRYDGSDRMEDVVRAKGLIRERLYREWQWQESSEPVIAFRSRWDNQKGVGLLGKCLDWILDRAKLAVVVWNTPGEDTGLRGLWEEFEKKAKDNPERFVINRPGIDGLKGTEAHYAVADMFLMPSRYEPCGLTQMECQRYGTIPVVRETGGLADTVSEKHKADFPSPNGFVFKEMDAGSMMEAVGRAVEAFHDAGRWGRLVQNALGQRNGWDDRVGEYEALFDKATGRG